jgi:dTDP-4-dehydrorhamnose reductase
VKNILITGGTGLLGTELQRLLQTKDDCNFVAPSHKDMDVSNIYHVNRIFNIHKPNICIHTACFCEGVDLCEDYPEISIIDTIIGTCNMILACRPHNTRFILISTDNVYPGITGNYRENDPLLPCTKYGWAKLGQECSARQYDNSLIIRTSFCEVPYHHEKAWVDQYSSKDTVYVIAPIILKASLSNIRGVLNIGTPEKTVYELAKRISTEKSIGKISIHDVSWAVPSNVSFNLDKMNKCLMEKDNE